MTRTVLITATYFSDEVFLGCLRINALARFLPDHGWRPVILTPSLPTEPALPRETVEILEYPDYRAAYARLKERTGTARHVMLAESGSSARRPSPARRAAHAAVEGAKRLAIPDPSIVWWPAGVRAASTFVQSGGHVDCVLSSSNPVTPHFIGHTLHRTLGVPWLADFRDLWTLNHYWPWGEGRRRLEAALERRLLRTADAVVTLSDEYIERLRRLYRDDSDRFHAIPLGYDPDIVPTLPARLTDEFTLTFTGNFVHGKRDPQALFRGLRLALDRGLVARDRLRVRFYGPRYAWIEERAAAEGLSDLVEQHGYVSRAEALERQRESQLLLLFLWNHPAERGAYSGKMEYLVAGRPIMALDAAEGGIWERLLADTGAGAGLRDPETTARYVGDAYAQYVESGAVPFGGDATALARFDYRNIVAEFAGVLDQLTAGAGR